MSDAPPTTPRSHRVIASQAQANYRQLRLVTLTEEPDEVATFVISNLSIEYPETVKILEEGALRGRTDTIRLACLRKLPKESLPIIDQILHDTKSSMQLKRLAGILYKSYA